MTVRIYAPARHDVFWATHACNRIRGHANPCRCSCGEVLPAGCVPYGNDQDSAVHAPRTSE